MNLSQSPTNPTSFFLEFEITKLTLGSLLRARPALPMLDVVSRVRQAYAAANADGCTRDAAPLDVLPLLMDEFCHKWVTDAQCMQLLNDAIPNEQLPCHLYAKEINVARCMPWIY